MGLAGMKAVLGTLETPLSLPSTLEVFCFYLLSLYWDLKINTFFFVRYCKKTKLYSRPFTLELSLIFVLELFECFVTHM